MKDLIGEFEIFKKNFNLSQKEENLKKLTEESLDPDLWSDQDKARRIMQDLADLKNEIEEVKSLDEELKILESLAKDGEDLGDESRYQIYKK